MKVQVLSSAPLLRTASQSLRFGRRLRVLGLATLLLAFALPVFAAAANTATIESTRARLETARLDDTQRQLATERLDAAAAEERSADGLQRQLLELRAAAAALPARSERLRQALALDRDQAIAEWAERLPRDADAETLERVLEQERSIIAELNAEIDAVAGELAQTLSRPAQAAGEIATLRRRIEDLSAPAPEVADEPQLLAEARRIARSSELRRTQTELELRVLEQDTATQRQRLFELTIRELRYRQGLHVRRTEVLQERIADLGRRQLDTLIARLAETETSFAEATGVLADTVAANRALGDELLQQNELLARDRVALAGNEEAKERIAASLRDSRARLELGGTNERVGRWLWSERRRLESPARLGQRLEAVRGALADARLRQVTLNEEARDLVDIPAAARARSAATPATVDDEATEITPSQALEPILQQQADLLALLEPLLQRRIAALEQTELALRTQIDDTRTLQQLLDRHLLWIPSHGPIGPTWFERIPEGLYDLVKPSRFLTTLDLSRRAVAAQPLPWLGSLALLVVLVELRRRARAQIESEAPITRQIRRDTYRATARALGWTLIAALPGPAAVYLLGLLIQGVGNPGRFSDSLGRALVMLFIPLLAVQVLRWTAIERGLGHAHFRWMRARREALRRTLPIAAAVVLPAYFVSTLAFLRNLELPNDVQARVAVVIACLALAWTAWQLLAAGRVWVVRGVELEPSSVRRALRIALPVVPLFIAFLVLNGYVYSATLLLQALLTTFAMIVLVTILAGLLGRWFLLGERRLAYQRQQERLAAQSGDARGDATPEPEAEITLEQVNAQTSRMLRVLRLTLVAAGLIAVWAEVLPAVGRLDEIALWHFTETGADGTPLRQPVTLMALLLGAFALALTTAGARNLPGLIEIGLLSRTHIDAGSRYAITSVLRYAIVITGTLIGLSLLGMRWSQLQWMAAALTVGLGFGLQEIFANFVSGLILLFERPFRVGDVITVGELTGRVTRIRTRATTILDFENKEIVVPNKSFITGQLINWTLSDTTTRVTIKVGVAYGSDPIRVRELLLQVAREQAQVLADPEPACWFLQFGASSLDFELRVYVGTLADRLQVQNAINTRIAGIFAEQGIEIAFPQLDLHVRDLPARVPRGGDQPSAPAA
ncbi:MAG: mechanosensitive ion channel [Pseudomonadales bacterium]|nr:mechanosensitive ion channel [Pseudomonadales bacterium]